MRYFIVNVSSIVTSPGRTTGARPGLKRPTHRFDSFLVQPEIHCRAACMNNPS